MENASKALIIAGAILLAILLISLGIMIFNQAQDIAAGAGMDEAAKTAFNNKFVKYEGTQKGTMVKALIQEVLASNASEDCPQQVTVNNAGGDTISSSSYDRKTTYTVTLQYTNGLVSNIVIG